MIGYLYRIILCPPLIPGTHAEPQITDEDPRKSSEDPVTSQYRHHYFQDDKPLLQMLPLPTSKRVIRLIIHDPESSQANRRFPKIDLAFA